MVAVVVLVVLGQFVVAVAGGADGGAGTLVGAVREHGDLPGRAGLDDAVGASRGQDMGASRGCAREPEPGAVRTGDDPHVHAVSAVLHRVVRLVCSDAVDRDRRAVHDDEVDLARTGQGLVQAGCPRGENVQDLVGTASGSCLWDTATDAELGECLVLPEMGQGEQGLWEAARFPPRRVRFTPSGVDEPGAMLDQLVRNVEHGSIRNQQGPSGRRRAEWNHHADDEGPCLVTAPTDQLISPLQHRMKEVR